MSRLTMQEVIEHCERTIQQIEKQHERYQNWLELEPTTINVKRYWEHKQTAEWLKELQHYKDLEEQGRLIEIKEGQWINNHCSICGMTPIGEEVWDRLGLDPPKCEYFMNYCPECGARMKVKNER